MESPTPSDPPPTEEPEEEPETDPDEQAPSSAGQVRDCVAGRWEIDKSSDDWDVPFGDADEVSGTIFMHSDPVLGFMLEYDDVQPLTMIVEEADYWVRADWDGSTIGEYDVDDDGLISLSVTDADITVTTEYHTTVATEEDEMSVGMPAEMVYECDGERLMGLPPPRSPTSTTRGQFTISWRKASISSSRIPHTHHG